MGKINKKLKNKKLNELEFLCKRKVVNYLLDSSNSLEYIDSGIDFICFKLEKFYFTAFCNRLKKEVTSIKSIKLFLDITMHDKNNQNKIYNFLSRKESIKINSLIELKNEISKINSLN